MPNTGNLKRDVKNQIKKKNQRDGDVPGSPVLRRTLPVQRAWI